MSHPKVVLWKDIPEYEGKYRVSTAGEIESTERFVYSSRKGKIVKYLRKGRILKQSKSPNGYLIVSLCKNSVQKFCTTHRLVAMAFIPNPENKPQINHKNGIKTDNRVENLEWSTQSENTHHAYNNKLIVPKVGEKVNGAFLDKLQVLTIRNSNPDEIPNKDLARYFKTTVANVLAIKAGKTWRHLL